MASGAAESGHYERALRAYIRILRIDAAHVDALFGAAVCAHNLGRLEDAIQYYGEAAKRYKRQQLVESSSPSSSSSAESISTELSGKNEPRLHLPAMCGAADCMAALGHFEDAIKQYSRVLKADPSYVPAYGGRADAWLSWGHSGDSRGEAAQQQATRDLEALLAVEPGNADALHGLGTQYVAAGRLSDAKQAFLSAVSSDPSHPRAVAALGSLCLEEGDLDNALLHSHSALSILDSRSSVTSLPKGSPQALQRAGLLAQRAAVHHAMGSHQECLEDAAAAEGLVQQHFGLALMLRGQSACELGRHGEAVAALSQVIEHLDVHESSLDGSVPLDHPQLARVFLSRATSHFGLAFPAYSLFEDQSNDENVDETRLVEEKHETAEIPELEPIVRETYALIREMVLRHHKSEAALSLAAKLDDMIQDCSKALQVHEDPSIMEDVYHLLACAQDALKKKEGLQLN